MSSGPSVVSACTRDRRNSQSVHIGTGRLRRNPLGSVG